VISTDKNHNKNNTHQNDGNNEDEGEGKKKKKKEEDIEVDPDGDEHESWEDEAWVPPINSEDYINGPFGNEARLLHFRVISAAHLPNPPGGSASSSSSGSSSSSDSEKTCVGCEIFGAPCDKKSFITKDVGNDGVKFVYDEGFSTLVAEPRLALLKLTVYRQSLPIAQTVVPVHLMRNGLRWVQLYDPISHSDRVSSDYLLTRLLVLVASDPLPNESDLKNGAGGKGKLFFGVSRLKKFNKTKGATNDVTNPKTTSSQSTAV